MNAWLLAYVLAPDDAETLRRCEAVPVAGMPEMVDVRMPKALWELIRG